MTQKAVLLACLTLACATLPVVLAFHCSYVSEKGWVYDLSPMGLYNPGENYQGTDAGYTYFANWCAPHSDGACAKEDGQICVYQDPKGALMSVLARTIRPEPEVTVLIPLVPRSGLRVNYDNGFFKSRQAIVSTFFFCNPDNHTRTLDVHADYNTTTFRFEIQTPYACPISAAEVKMKQFALPLDRSHIKVPVVLTSLPNRWLILTVDHPFIDSVPLNVTGPANGRNTTVWLDVKLNENAADKQGSFVASVVITGADSTSYKFPQATVLVNTTAIVPPSPAPSSGISGGSVFLIIFFVGGFLYVLSGCLWNHSKHGTSGMTAFPHIEWWTSVWEYAGIGVKYCLQKLTCGRSAMWYSEI